MPAPTHRRLADELRRLLDGNSLYTAIDARNRAWTAVLVRTEHTLPDDGDVTVHVIDNGIGVRYEVYEPQENDSSRLHTPPDLPGVVRLVLDLTRRDPR
ncbi:hypothetical protein Ppa06_57380 [Planomonospora parontospora subsp. parontospora]|uniref:Uncharacterized protein n=2 Tax=Planomonospora parontospora TaxID=58119 RepID=A0AA37BLL8_9ACTN|nr:hypothetical protein [Planomonospora parontospora]GGK90884.1 hypothetical protein GCM10010126_57920 [Planomonospora parontospora]GII11940.1 hypothetical protein Ppa06_57380 [Planomonospora parontospora subsp. parontospora]